MTKYRLARSRSLKNFKYYRDAEKTMEINCKKCNEKMRKKGMIQSGNSKYELYLCNECGSEEMKAIGVNERYHR